MKIDTQIIIFKTNIINSMELVGYKFKFFNIDFRIKKHFLLPLTN
jgi:hypothetical protein